MTALMLADAAAAAVRRRMERRQKQATSIESSTKPPPPTPTATGAALGTAAAAGEAAGVAAPGAPGAAMTMSLVLPPAGAPTVTPVAPTEVAIAAALEALDIAAARLATICAPLGALLALASTPMPSCTVSEYVPASGVATVTVDDGPTR